MADTEYLFCIAPYKLFNRHRFFAISWDNTQIYLLQHTSFLPEESINSIPKHCLTFVISCSSLWLKPAINFDMKHTKPIYRLKMCMIYKQFLIHTFYGKNNQNCEIAIMINKLENPSHLSENLKKAGILHTSGQTPRILYTSLQTWRTSNNNSKSVWNSWFVWT